MLLLKASLACRITLNSASDPARISDASVPAVCGRFAGSLFNPWSTASESALGRDALRSRGGAADSSI